MTTPVEITFRHMPASAALEQTIRERALRLVERAGRPVACRVLVEAPQGNHQHGARFHVRVDVRVPGAELVTDRDPGEAATHDDAYVAVRDAFRAAERAVVAHERRRREVARD